MLHNVVIVAFKTTLLTQTLTCNANHFQTAIYLFIFPNEIQLNTIIYKNVSKENMMKSQHFNSYLVHQMKKMFFFSHLKCVVKVWKFLQKLSKFHNIIKVAINLFFYANRPQASKYLLFFDLLRPKNTLLDDMVVWKSTFAKEYSDSTQMCLCVGRIRNPRMWRQRTDSFKH